MLISAKQHPLNNLSLSIVSLILGYALWQTLSQPYKITTHLSVPISFYNTHNATLEAPDAVTVALHGTRKELYKLMHNLAVHIDAQTVPVGESHIQLTNKNLFLPESVLLLHYVPKELLIKKT